MSTKPRPFLKMSLGAAGVILCLVLTVTAPNAAMAAGSILKAFVGAAGTNDADPRSPGNKTYGPGILSPDALQGCLVLAHRIDSIGADLDRQIRDLRDLDQLIDEEGPALKEASKVKFRDAAATKELERRVAKYNAHIRERLKRVRNYNLNTEAYQGLASDFDSNCNGQAFYRSDLAAIVPRLPEAVRAALR